MERIDSLYEGAVVTIEAGDSKIETTIHHPFWVVKGHELTARSTPRELSDAENQGQALPGRWVNSHELQAGDVIIGKDGETRTVSRISQRFEQAFAVSNLTIEEYHNYSVGADSILVHNDAICDEGVEWLKGLLASGEASYDDIARFLRKGGYDNADEVLKKLSPNKVVIGKLKDLNNLRPGENTLLKHLPNKGTPKATWAQNSSVLRREMRKGLPIRDASVGANGELISYPGSFLEAERNLLRSHGWRYDPGTQLWNPPQ